MKNQMFVINYKIIKYPSEIYFDENIHTLQSPSYRKYYSQADKISPAYFMNVKRIGKFSEKSRQEVKFGFLGHF